MDKPRTIAEKFKLFVHKSGPVEVEIFDTSGFGFRRIYSANNRGHKTVKWDIYSENRSLLEILYDPHNILLFQHFGPVFQIPRVGNERPFWANSTSSAGFYYFVDAAGEVRVVCIDFESWSHIIVKFNISHINVESKFKTLEGRALRALTSSPAMQDVQRSLQDQLSRLVINFKGKPEIEKLLMPHFTKIEIGAPSLARNLVAEPMLHEAIEPKEFDKHKEKEFSRVISSTLDSAEEDKETQPSTALPPEDEKFIYDFVPVAPGLSPILSARKVSRANKFVLHIPYNRDRPKTKPADLAKEIKDGVWISFPEKDAGIYYFLPRGVPFYENILQRMRTAKSNTQIPSFQFYDSLNPLHPISISNETFEALRAGKLFPFDLQDLFEGGSACSRISKTLGAKK